VAQEALDAPLQHGLELREVTRIEMTRGEFERRLHASLRSCNRRASRARDVYRRP